jgi:hypothetical protein
MKNEQYIKYVYEGEERRRNFSDYELMRNDRKVEVLDYLLKKEDKYLIFSNYQDLENNITLNYVKTVFYKN